MFLIADLLAPSEDRADRSQWLMDQTQDLSGSRLAHAWAELQAHARDATPLDRDAYRLAFADPEFLLRRETRGIRFQLEMLKPDLGQQEQGIESTVVVFGSADRKSVV